MITVAVLGPLEVRRDGVLLPVPAGRSAEVLVRLALEAGRPVRAERIIDDLWGSAGRNTLQSKVSQLRRALGDPGLVVARDGGYLLEVGAEAVDALRVAELAAAAGAARRAGDATRAREVAAGALALFRGDLPGGDWFQGHRVRLEEIRLGLIEDLAAARVELGATGEVIGELEALAAAHPLREGLWFWLITALYRAGRQGDALSAYTRVRNVLIDELGVEPGAELRDLHGRILRATAGGNLPALSSPLIGRAAEVRTVGERLGERRLVTLTGPAGVGKTRLAVEAARRLRVTGGVWLVRLDTATATTAIPQLIAETMRVAPADLEDRLAGAKTVLVLDNCEHLAGPVAAVAERLLTVAPDLRVLATSQVPLGLDGEHVHPLAPLPPADAVALFTARARESRRHFTLDPATAATVEEVCRSLDGLPLAIELAAARVKALPVREIARRLDDRFTLLRDLSGHRALATAIGWSYDLLTPDDQRGLQALSVFADGASLPAFEHVFSTATATPSAAATATPSAAAAASAVDVVGRLVDRSLVGAEFLTDGTVRYRLLDSIRLFARSRADSLDGAAAAHASWFAQEADRQAATVRGAGQLSCLAVARTERANVDAALTWCATHDPALGVRIANGFGWTWVVLGDGVAGATRIRDALAALPGPAADRSAVDGLRDRAVGLLLAGWLEASAGDVGRAEADLDEASDLAERLDDDRLRADARRHRAFLRIQQGRPQDAVSEAMAALPTCWRLGLDWEVAASLLLASYGAIMRGDSTSAAGSAGAAARLLAPLGDAWGEVHAEGMLGAIAHAERRFEAAARSLSKAAEAADRLGFLGQAALHLTTLGRVQHRSGDPSTAAATLTRAILAARTSGDQRVAATARVNLARVHRAAGDLDAARELLTRADAWYRAAGGDGALLTRCLLATTEDEQTSILEEARATANEDELMSILEEARATGNEDELTSILEEARATGNTEVEVLASDLLARRAAERGDRETARRLLEAADAVASRSRHTIDEPERLDAAVVRGLL